MEQEVQDLVMAETDWVMVGMGTVGAVEVMIHMHLGQLKQVNLSTSNSRIQEKMN